MRRSVLLIPAITLVLFIWTETVTAASPVKHKKIQSEVGKNFSIKCPEKFGVYGVEVEFKDEYLAKPNGKGYHEWQWTIYCRKFVPDDKEDKGDEDCSDKAAVAIAFNELVYEDGGMNCDCNEYLGGITGKVEQMYFGENNQRQRSISLRCCKKKTNFIEIRSCEIIGPKTLFFPEGPVKFLALKDWDVDGTFEYPKYFVTGVSIYDNSMMMIQQCRFAVKEVHKKAKELKKKIKDAKCDFFYMRDMMTDFSKIKKCEDVPTGWPRPMIMSNQDPSLWGTLQSWGYKYFNNTGKIATDALQFSDQFTVCADGQIIYSVSKYVRYKNVFDKKEGKNIDKKDYVFLAKCTEFEQQPCQCKWNTTCDEKNWNKTCADDDSGETEVKCQKYWSGFKSQYIKKDNKRKFEIFCCTSSSINFVDCNWTRWQNDTDVKMILPKPRIKSYSEGGVGDVVAFRDFRVKWEGKNMLVQYNVCNTNSSGSPGCHYPCFPKLEQESKSLSDAASGGAEAAAAAAAAAAAITTSTASTVSTSTGSTSATSSSSSTSTTRTTTTTTTTKKDCGPFDFAFLLDSSASLQKTGYNFEKTFLVNFAKHFQFAPSAGNNQSRASLVLFSGTAIPQFDLTKFENDPSADVNLAAAINALPFLQSETDIYNSILDAKKYFEASPPAPGTTRVTILITDGLNNMPGFVPVVSPKGDWTDAQRQANLQAAVKDLKTITGDTFYGVFTSDGVGGDTEFGLSANDFFYAPKPKDLNANVLVNLVSQICADNRNGVGTLTA